MQFILASRNVSLQLGYSFLIYFGGLFDVYFFFNRRRLNSLRFLNLGLNLNLISSLNFIRTLNLYKNLSLFLFNVLVDVFGLDLISYHFFNFFYTVKDRFGVIYSFLTLSRFRCFFLLFWDFGKIIFSISLLYCGANWVEREVWDMFGIFFCKHFNLRRILTDYGFVGFPLRKDFPVVGFIEVYYEKEVESVVYDKISLSQENRIFDFLSAWS